MRYILVNCHNKAEDAYCAFCHLNIEKSYLREISTGLVYHNPFCYEVHVISMQKYLEDVRERNIQ